MAKSFLLKIYSYIFLYELIFAYAVYNLLFANNGLSEFEISVLLGWWAFVAVVFEIPSGVLADRFSRKWLIVISPIMKAITFLIWGIFDGNFFLYALGFLVWGFASTLITGTYQAYIYDALSKNDLQDSYEKVIGKVNFSKKFGTALGLIFGGLIASISLQLAMIFSIIPLIIGALIALSLEEYKAAKQTEESKYEGYISRSLKLVSSSSTLRFLFLSIVAVSIFGNLEEYDQLYYKLVDLPVIYFGLVAFVPFAGGAIVESLSYKLKGKTSMFVLLPLASAVLLSITAIFPSIPTLVALIAAYIIISPLNVLIDGKIQREIVGEGRATVISFSSFLKHIFGIGNYLLFGLIIELTSLTGIYITAAVVLVIYCLAVISNKKLL